MLGGFRFAAIHGVAPIIEPHQDASSDCVTKRVKANQLLKSALPHRGGWHDQLLALTLLDSCVNAAREGLGRVELSDKRSHRTLPQGAAGRSTSAPVPQSPAQRAP